MNIYAAAHIVHLYCALIFVGGVFFEALVLSALHGRRVSREARREAHGAVSHRAVRVMPWAVAALFVSGGVMVWERYLPLLQQPFASSFGGLLALKIVLAFSVLAHFLTAVAKMVRHTMTAAWSKYIHAAVLVHMLLIVFLAKAMFYS
ncbi:hypothetical protein L4G92_02755 [Neisseria sp. ZJ106]|uniref:Integral membrane protein n=1 Tax=Neisseria lisongii TaxID=2912188 RepID=A0AAW5AKI6_9NEIS|nr:hypothetical protein [Neisseria lisongii]MCF7520974.1 hypothetical protein [Neisseria lisongii]MCF7528999.1 hypothetical protein [Neisseria lisongii]WCL71223.1 hypothetical protein PJU73_07755 [Neisseria lisongii]